ncbi:MAG: tetratricopeptide repeat protein [Nitrospira sp.]|nr:MAG: tetratricopeptide repeat protein [Nitrospira sp.]
MRKGEPLRERHGVRRCLPMLGVILVLAASVSCSWTSKPKPLVPLALESGVKPQVITLTEQGTLAYHAKQFDEAKQYFSKAVAEVPQSGPARYNYALALYALGNTEEARQQFMEAANLAPGDQVIWDSPALRPYGDPESPKKNKPLGPGGARSGPGSGPRY